MKTLLLSAAAAVLTVASASAQSLGDTLTQGEFNLGLGYAYLDGEGVEFDALALRGGYDVTANFGLEAEALFGLDDETAVYGGSAVNLGLDYGYGVYAKAQYPALESVSLFGRAGYFWNSYDVSTATVAYGDDNNGVALGAGAEWKVATCCADFFTAAVEAHYV